MCEAKATDRLYVFLLLLFFYNCNQPTLSCFSFVLLLFYFSFVFIFFFLSQQVFVSRYLLVFLPFLLFPSLYNKSFSPLSSILFLFFCFVSPRSSPLSFSLSRFFSYSLLYPSLFLFFLFLSYFFHQIPLFLSSHRVLSLLLYLQRVPLAPRLSHLVLLTSQPNHYTPAPPFSFHVPQTIQFIRRIIRGVASNPTPPQTRSTFQPPSFLLSSSLPSMNRGMLREKRYTFSLFLYMKDLNMADFQLRLLPPAGALQRNCRRSLKRISEKKEEMRKSGIEKSLIFFFYFSNILCLENINRSRNIKNKFQKKRG